MKPQQCYFLNHFFTTPLHPLPFQLPLKQPHFHFTFFHPGHVIDNVLEIPLVLKDAVQEIKKTKQAVTLLKKHKVWPDIEKVKASKRFRAGKGKMRNRRRIQKRGPLVIYDKDNGITKAFRNIPGITLISVDRLNLLKLAPGGHVGRFCIWTESAFKQLDSIFGTWTRTSDQKEGYT